MQGRQGQRVVSRHIHSFLVAAECYGHMKYASILVHKVTGGETAGWKTNDNEGRCLTLRGQRSVEDLRIGHIPVYARPSPVHMRSRIAAPNPLAKAAPQSAIQWASHRR